MYSGGKHNDAELLACCYRTCLRLAEEHGAAVVSFPAISTGVYRYPLAEAARIATEVVLEDLQRDEAVVREVVFVLFDRAAYDAYAQALGYP